MVLVLPSRNVQVVLRGNADMLSRTCVPIDEDIHEEEQQRNEEENVPVEEEPRAEEEVSGATESLESTGMTVFL